MSKEGVDSEKDDKIPVSLKIDKDLYEKVKEQATANFRSINKQIVYLISVGINHHTTESIKES